MKAWRLKLIPIVLCLSVLVIWILNKKANVQTVHVLFPTNILVEGPELLDPSNTESVYEYYLLENLACGLVRDSKTSPTGYEGCLADSFHQPAPHTWVFKLKHLMWSDGTDVSEIEIRNWLSSLHTLSTRHIRVLNQLSGFEYSHSDRTLAIIFPFSVNFNILHELSLADAGFFPPEFKTRGWTKTTGPYFVKSWSKKESSLILEANHFSALYRPDMPAGAVLYPLKNLSDRTKIFKSIPYDLVLLDSMVSPVKSQELLQNAPQVFEAYPTAIVYFYFNINNIHGKAEPIRLRFVNGVESFRKHVSRLTEGSSPFAAESQLIPDGFQGRLPQEVAAKQVASINSVPIKVRVPSSIFDYANLVETFKTELYKFGFEVSVIANDGSPLKESDFAVLTSFIGNQSDSSGSWSFLAGPPRGNLSSFFKFYESEFNEVFDGENLSERKGKLEKLHRRILEGGIAVPLMIGRQRYLLSDRVDVSAWNKFDARLRIYEVKWTQ